MLPRLLHPFPTQIQTAEPETASQDEGYREPVQTIGRSKTFTIAAQWKWFSDREIAMNRSGAEESSDGYVLLRYVDLRALGKQVNRGDRIIGYGTGAAAVKTDLYVVKLRHEGHYPDQGGPALVKAFFADRQPAHQTRGA